MFKWLLLHGFVLSIRCSGIHCLTVGAVGCVVFCGCGIFGLLRLSLCILSGGHAAVPAETADTCINISFLRLEQMRQLIDGANMFYGNGSRSVYLTGRTGHLLQRLRKDSTEDMTAEILATNQVHSMKAYQTTGFTDNEQEKKEWAVKQM